MTGHEKVVSLERLAELTVAARWSGQRVAHCHGCFDILHVGHLWHFEAAKALADVLVVTVTPDEFVNKGPDRPVFPQAERAQLIGGLGVVDWVAVNRWPSAVEAIRIIRPDLFVKGEEYEAPDQRINLGFAREAQAIAEVGGTVAFTRDPKLSSTRALQRLLGRAR